MKGKHNGKFRRFYAKGNREVIFKKLEGACKMYDDTMRFFSDRSRAIVGDPPEGLRLSVERLHTAIDALVRQLWALDHREYSWTIDESRSDSFVFPMFDDEWEVLFLMKRPPLPVLP